MIGFRLAATLASVILSFETFACIRFSFRQRLCFRNIRGIEALQGEVKTLCWTLANVGSVSWPARGAKSHGRGSQLCPEHRLGVSLACQCNVISLIEFYVRSCLSFDICSALIYNFRVILVCVLPRLLIQTECLICKSLTVLYHLT